MDGFKLGGRLNRISYIIFFVELVVVYSVFVLFWDAYLAKDISRSMYAIKRNKMLWEFVMAFEWTVNIYLLYSLAMRRIRDFGKGAIFIDIIFPIFYVLILCVRRVPGFLINGFLFTIMLLLIIPGSDKKINQYGEADKGRNPLHYIIYAGIYLLLLSLVNTPWLLFR